MKRKIEFHYECDFKLTESSLFADWLTRVINGEGTKLKKLDYIFCDDSYLLAINKQYLNHDTFTDIITFDYTEDSEIAGDIFISVDRVKENSESYNVNFNDELKRVMAHGVLHLLGYGDKLTSERQVMRSKEDEAIKMFHVER